MANRHSEAQDEHQKAGQAPQRGTHAAPGLGATEDLPGGVDPVTMLTNPQLSGRGNAPLRAAALQRMQQTYGNRAVQRILQQHAGGARAIQRTAPGAAAHPLPAITPPAVQRAEPAGATTTPAAPAAASAAPAAAPAAPATTPASDPAIDALDLGPTAKAAALALKALHPEITFTSGRRDVAGQAHAMASNIVSSGNRKWIAETYVSAATLQKWVDDHPEAKTVDEISTGLETTMNAMSDSDRAKVSKHLGGAAFDVQPQDKDAEQIKKDIQALTGITKFLEKESGLVRWHAQF